MCSDTEACPPAGSLLPSGDAQEWKLDLLGCRTLGCEKDEIACMLGGQFTLVRSLVVSFDFGNGCPPHVAHWRFRV